MSGKCFVYVLFFFWSLSLSLSLSVFLCVSLCLLMDSVELFMGGWAEFLLFLGFLGFDGSY